MAWKMPRFRVRTLLLGVVIVALGLGGFVWANTMWHRHAIHQKWEVQCGRLAAKIHELGETHARIVLRGGTSWPSPSEPAEGTFIPSDRAPEAVAYLLEMKSHFHRAANLPWLNVRFRPPPPGLEGALAAVCGPGAVGSPGSPPGAFVIVGSLPVNPRTGGELAIFGPVTVDPRARDDSKGVHWLPLTERRRSRIAAPR